MDTKTMLSKIKELLNAKVELASAVLDNGTTIEADSFEAGSNVFIVSDGEKIPMPIGEYTTDDGKKLVVEEEGVIASFNLEDEKEEEMEHEDDHKEMEDKKEELEDEVVEVEAPAEIAPEIEEVVEAVVEVIAPVIEEVKAEIEKMKKDMYEEEEKEEEMEEDKKKEELSKPARKPLKHSPENNNIPSLKKLSNQQGQTTMDRVFARISKIK